MRSRQLASIFLLSAALLACSTVRETRPLTYPGDPRSTTEPLAEVLKKRGYQPICSPREYCKFAYNDRITIHFKLKSDQAVIAVDVADGKKLPSAELQRLIAEGMKVGEDIFNEARPAALAREEEARRAQETADREEAARRAQEAALREEEARRARELAAQQPVAPAPAPAPGAPVAPAAPAAPAPAEVNPEITYGDDLGRTAFQLREPEGTACEIVGDNVWAGTKRLEIPFRMEAIGKTYYTFECKLPSGAVWRKKLEAKDGRVTIVRLLSGGASAAAPAPAPGAPAPAAAPAQPSAMAPDAFAALSAAVQKESFADNKLRVIQVASATNWLSVAQVAALVDLLSQSSDKVKVVELARGRIVDRQNAHALLSHFTFSGDKAKVQQLLGM